jgi:hypothetical protein
VGVQSVGSRERVVGRRERKCCMIAGKRAGGQGGTRVVRKKVERHLLAMPAL